ncbi:putative 12-oxophytodienoate reductase 5 [Iris pallida]|uniref:12-oxophytodienoate reductase 5 n=1 Tax=Iris pallida TaxID=29817 RepID=A0AAX6HTR8_IRIPA|nr:putative 12-oxophytodienoate reductase 5 [Iris pallida]
MTRVVSSSARFDMLEESLIPASSLMDSLRSRVPIKAFPSASTRWHCCRIFDSPAIADGGDPSNS